MADRPEQETQMEVWDPLLGRNVYTGGGAGNEAYITANPETYAGYTGPVSYVGAQPITTEAYGMRHAPAPEGAPDPFQYQQASQRTALYGQNPYDTEQMNDYITQISNQARVLPGVRPNVGYIPGVGGVNLLNNLPSSFWENQGKKWQLDPIEQKMVDLASQGNLNFPTIKSLTNDQGINRFDTLSGRGYQYAGSPSDRETELANALLSGQNVDMNELSQLRSNRVKANQPSAMQQIATKYYGPLIAALAMAPVAPGVGAAAGPIAGAAAGAATGAFTSGAMTRWQNPGSIAAGAGAGLAGGAAGSLTSGAGPAISGAAAGASSAGTQALIKGLVSGRLTWDDVIRALTTGAVTGGASGLFSNPLARAAVSSAARAGMQRALPRSNPYAR